MLEELTLGEKLKDLRVNHGYTLDKLEKLTGISKGTLSNYENDDKNQAINHLYLVELAKLYRVTTDYLMGATACDKESRTDIADIYLTDEAIAVLKSRKIHPRLLCDLLTHEKFPDFMSNIEIFVDEIAKNCFHKVNREIGEIYDCFQKQDLPPEEKKHLPTLKASAIQSDRYFKAVVYEDLDTMMGEIREKQRRNEKDPYHTLQKADVQTQVKEWTKSFKKMDEQGRILFLEEMDVKVGILIEQANLDILDEGVEETALRRLLSLNKHTPEQLTDKEREDCFKIVRRDRKMWERV
ncbi:MAG: helix-turn-helix transcriptional regulator [Eubacteriales bacterium]